MDEEGATEQRRSVRRMLRAKVPDVNEDTCTRVETGVYNWAIEQASARKIVKNWGNPRFVQLYASKARSVVANLDGGSYIGNERLKDRMLDDKEFLPQALPFLRRENAFPLRWQEHLDLKLRRDVHVYEEKPAAMTDQYKCSKCHKRECVYHELQLRSADEPISVFVTCINCGARWRLS